MCFFHIKDEAKTRDEREEKTRGKYYINVKQKRMKTMVYSA